MASHNPLHAVIRLLLVTLAIALVHHADRCHADPDRNCDTFRSQRAHSRGLCGPTLTSTLMLVCDTLLQQGMRVKRSPGKELMGHRLQGISMQPKDALSYLTKRQSQTGTILCECCYNQCTVREIAQYCDFFGMKKRDGGIGLPSQAHGMDDPPALGYF